MTTKNYVSGSRIATEQRPAVTTEFARRKLGFKLQFALQTETNTLIDAPTSLGKTYQVATTPWRDYPEVTGGQPVIHLHETTETRDQAAKMSEEVGLEYANLKSGLDICTVATGEYDSDFSAEGQKPSNWLRARVNSEGLAFHEAHNLLEQLAGGLPCGQGDGCEASNRWDHLPRNEDETPCYDVIHATHEFAYVAPLVKNANIVFDERPQFDEEVDRAKRGMVHDGVNQALADFGFNGSWSGLVQAVLGETEDLLSQYHEVLWNAPSGSNKTGSNSSYSKTAEVGAAVARAKRVLARERYKGKAGATSVLLDGQGTLRQIHRPPDLSNVRCVIGLDAHPTPQLWQLNTVEDITPERVLGTDDRKQWRRFRRGLHLVQVGEASRAYTRQWRGAGKEKAEAIIKELRRRHSEDFSTAISSRATESDVERMLMDAGAEAPRTMHYGDLKSRNDFEDESVGLLVGCIDPGDERILDWLALCGLRALPKEEDGERKYGREFFGPDADAASELLASVRENNLAQAAGRYARHPESPGTGATVYVWSSALPDHLTDGTVPGVISRVTSLKQEVQQFVRAEGTVTKKETVEELDISPTHAYNVLQEMAEQGVVTVSKGTGPYGADEYDYNEGTLRRSVDLGF